VSWAPLRKRALLILRSMSEQGGAPFERARVLCMAERESDVMASMYESRCASSVQAMARSHNRGGFFQ